MDIDRLIEELKKEYRYKVEPHNHTTPVSPCGKISPEELVNRLAALGYDCIALTNHYHSALDRMPPKEMAEFYLNDYYRAKAEGEKLGLTVVLGVEITFKECRNDYLVYGINDEDILKMREYWDRGIEAFYKEFRNERNIVIQAHPFRHGLIFKPEFVDMAEVYNTNPNHNSNIGMACRASSEVKLNRTIGNDVHARGQEGKSAMLFREKPKDSYDLARLIKSKDFIFSMGDDIILPRKY